jgi:hypothetical protein
MRLFLSQKSKKELYQYLKKSTKSRNIYELAKKLKISKKTLDDWFYNRERYIPENIIPEGFVYKIKSSNRKPDNWGNVIGGEESYKTTIRKYGKKEIKKRQSNGGKSSLSKRNTILEKNFKIDVDDLYFSEFYGALLGDGWLSHLSYRGKYKKDLWWVGVSGHAKLDRKYLMFLGKIIKKMLNKKINIKYKKGTNSMEILFCNRPFILFLNKKLGFPIGKKKNLEIYNGFLNDYNKMICIIRGIFDTDGCFYLSRASNGKGYHRISITMKAPILIKQVHKFLTNNGFNAKHYIKKDGVHVICLFGEGQTKKWMEEIGSSNSKHLNKIRACSSAWRECVPPT